MSALEENVEAATVLKAAECNQSSYSTTTVNQDKKQEDDDDVHKRRETQSSSTDESANVASAKKVAAAESSVILDVKDSSENKKDVDVDSVKVEENDNDEEEEMGEREKAEEKKDVEKFGGKIVYNPDGSAYIIDDDGCDEEAANCPVQDGSIVENEGDAEKNVSYPQIANAIYISRRTSAAYYSALCGQAYANFKNLATTSSSSSSSPNETAVAKDAPIVHSYRVFSLRNKEVGDDESSSGKNSSTPTSVPEGRPILMCFICKLSFGYSKSFEGHCTAEHAIDLTKEEKEALEAKNSSAIIQIVGEKGGNGQQQTIVNFLEPVANNTSSFLPPPPLAPVAAAAPASDAESSLDEVQLLSQQTTPKPSTPTKENELDKNSASSQLQQQNQQQQQALSASAIKGLLSAALSGGPGGAAAAEMLLARQLQQQQQTTHSRSQTPASESDQQDQIRLPLPPRLPDFPNIPTTLPLPTSLMDFALPLALRNPLGPPPGSYLSNDNCPSPLSSSFLPSTIPSNANMLQGTTIGACPDHVNGRKAGIECANCDLILNSSRMPGGMGWNAARNSCKTLKCPKCNWHYKYQETLEIHMKEKHPDSETTCIYCITGQQHPRLARGETYTCGYKPYRCEVCNYSTTTKGNLSIHMQSDKHLNNMQELQNGGVLVPSSDGSRICQSPVGRGMPALGNLAKQKPNWRCDVCNYETNVARNLRIHMTSEKHTHNIMVLQQNVKHMQQLSQGGGGGGGPHPGSPMSFPGLFPGLMPGMDPLQMLQMNMQDKSPGSPIQPEVAMADISFLQALMMQMMTGGQFPGGPPPGSFNSPSPSMVNEQNSSPMDIGVSPDSMEPPPEPADPNPNFLFNCCVCRQFGSDSLDHLSQHLTQDRTKIREHEVSIVIAGNFICKLCSYKTNLKANFQLHCKTDKHLQRLNHVNHIKEGGMANEWKLKFLNVTNPVQLRCNSCDYYTNSLHKLQLHVANQRHEISTILFAHLKKSEMSVPDDRRKSYNCCLCKFTSSGKLLLMAHVRSMKHLQMEQIHQLQKRSEGNATQTEIGDIFQVVDRDANEEERASSNTSAADQEKTNNESGKKFNFETLVHHFDGCDLRSSFHGFAQKSCFVWLL
jgi:AT-binding transcription factor 1